MILLIKSMFQRVKPPKFSACGELALKTFSKLVSFRFGRGPIFKKAPIYKKAPPFIKANLFEGGGFLNNNTPDSKKWLENLDFIKENGAILLISNDKIKVFEAFFTIYAPNFGEL